MTDIEPVTPEVTQAEQPQEKPVRKPRRKKAEREAAHAAVPSDAEPQRKRRALVTGASSGIGEEFARQLAKKRYDLVLVARRRERLENLAAELVEAHGTDAEVIAGDLATPEGIHTVEKRLGQGDIDLLVNNAGFATRGVFANMSIDRELEEMDVNIKALVRLTRAALEPMVQRKRGAVINLGSVGSFQPVPYMSTYAATKAFVLHFSEGVHEEVKPHGVTVTCLCPGYVMTEFQQVAGIDRRRLRGAGKVSVQQVVEEALKGAAAGRAVVIPGALNRTLASGLIRLTPRFAVRRIAGAMFRDAGVE